MCVQAVNDRVEASDGSGQLLVFDTFLTPLTVAPRAQPGSRRRPPHLARSVNDVAPPPGLTIVQLCGVRLDMQISSHNTETRASSGPAFKTRHSGPDLLTSSLLEAVPVTTFAQVQDLTSTRDLINCAVASFMFHARPELAANLLWQLRFTHNLQNTFPVAFSPKHLRTVVEISHLVTSICRGMESFMQRGRADNARSIVSTPESSCRPDSGSRTSSEARTIRHVDAWQCILSKLADSYGMDNLPGSLLAGQNSGAQYAERHQRLPESQFSTKNHDWQGHVALLDAEKTADGLFISSAPTKDYMGHGLTASEPTLSAQRARQCVSSSNCLDCFDSSFEDLCGDSSLLQGCFDDWTSTDISPVSSQASTVQSEMQKSQQTLDLYDRCKRLSKEDEWESALGERQQLSQSSGRIGASGLSLITPDERDHQHAISRTHFENHLPESFHVDTVPIEAAPQDHRTTANVDLLEGLTDLSSKPVSGALEPQEILLDSDCLFEEHYKAASSQVGNQMAAMRTGTSDSNPSSPRHSHRSSILSFGSLHRRESTLIAGYCPSIELKAEPIVMDADSVSRTSSSETRVMERRSSLLRKLTRHNSSKSAKEESGAAALNRCNVKGRDVELKRRKTLDDYVLEDEQEDEEMLFG